MAAEVSSKLPLDICSKYPPKRLQKEYISKSSKLLSGSIKNIILRMILSEPTLNGVAKEVGADIVIDIDKLADLNSDVLFDIYNLLIAREELLNSPKV